MDEPLPRRMIPILLVGLLMSGCAAPPVEKPVVLHRPSPHRPPRAAPKASARAPALLLPAERDEGVPEPIGMTPDDKAALFQDFDRYLSQHPPKP